MLVYHLCLEIGFLTEILRGYLPLGGQSSQICHYFFATYSF